MKTKSIPLFRIFGIQVNLDFSWFAVFFLVSFSLAVHYYPYYYPGHSFLVYLLVGSISAILLFVSVLLHELAHSLVAKRFSIPVKEIDLFIFGGVAMMEEEAPSPKAEFLIAIAGPLCSFALAFLFLFFAYIYPQNDLLNGVINYLVLVNTALGGFNLIPAFPLDGGRILRAIIWAKKDIITATKISSAVGKAFAYLLMLFGVLFLVQGNFVNALWMGLLGWFLKNSAEISYQQTIVSAILSRYKVEQFMDTVRPILPEETIQDFFRTYPPVGGLTVYPVIGRDGRFYLFNITSVRQIPQEQWETTVISEISSPMEVYVSPYDTLLKAYKLMVKYGLEEIPVVYGNTILGVIRRQKIEEVIDKHLREL
ncbi:MAG: site-2 protease family protein [Aquificae bacterium]|nr:site-2 protease family protein [Aquificota bacterium]